VISDPHIIQSQSGKPGAAKNRILNLAKYAADGVGSLSITTAPYPSGFGKLFRGGGVNTLGLKGGYKMKDTICKSLGVGVVMEGNIPKSIISYTGKVAHWNTEHWREVRPL
jgi:chitinase